MTTPYGVGGQQLTYATKMRTAFAGMLAYASKMKDFIKSIVAGEVINYGYGIVQDLANPGQARNPRAEGSVLLFSGALITSNVINGNVVVNGVVHSLSPVDYNTSDAQTLADIATAIALVSGVASATAGTHDVTVVADAETDVRLTSFVVTAGSSQATASVTYTSVDKFLGAAVAGPLEVAGAGFQQYIELGYTERTFGIWVPISHDVSQGDTVYVDLTTATLGQFTNQSTNSLATGGKFDNDGTSGGLAIAVFNNP